MARSLNGCNASRASWVSRTFRFGNYNTLKTQLESQLDAGNAKYTPTSPATRTEIPPRPQPAPEQPEPPGPHVPQSIQDVLKQINEGMATGGESTGHRGRKTLPK